MAGTPTPLTDMAEGTVLAGGDWTYLVDVSDTTDGTAGSSKKVQAKYWAQTNGSPATITNGGTIALGGYTATVPGTGTLVTTAGSAALSNKSFSDDVGVGTATPDGNARIHVYKDANQSAAIRIQNPNTGNATDSSILFMTDGGTAQAGYIAKTGTAHASEPNLLAIVNREGDISLRTDGGTVGLSDAGGLTLDTAGWAWANITPATGWGTVATAPQYRIVDDMVFLRGILKRTGSAGTNLTMGTLPAGYRPGHTVGHVCWFSNVPVYYSLTITAAGVMIGDFYPNNIATDDQCYLDGVVFSTDA